MPRAVLLLSGGLDSTTLLAYAVNERFTVHAMTFRYGQRHAVEIEAARRIAALYGVRDHVIVDVDLRTFGGSALTSDVAVPKDRANQIGIPITYVPARNTIFLSFALAWAEVLEAGDIFIGVNALDYSGYPDCRDDTLKALQVTLNLGMEQRFVLDTPLMWIDKAQTFALANDIGGDRLMRIVLEHTHSCYMGDRTHRHDWGYGCGTCPACELRSQGWLRYSGKLRNA